MIRRPPRSTRTDNTLSLHDARPILWLTEIMERDGVDAAAALFSESTGRVLVTVPREEDVKFRGLCTGRRSEEHTSELQSLMRISYAVFCLKKKNNNKPTDI